MSLALIERSLSAARSGVWGNSVDAGVSSAGRLVHARNLGEADAVVQFTEHRPSGAAFDLQE